MSEIVWSLMRTSTIKHDDDANGDGASTFLRSAFSQAVSDFWLMVCICFQCKGARDASRTFLWS